MFSKKKRKPDVVRKDVQWSTKKPHMFKKNGTQSETNKTGLPWSTNWLNPNCESKVSFYKKSCTSTVKIPCKECLFPKCVVVVCLFVSLFCIFYIYDESLLTTSKVSFYKKSCTSTVKIPCKECLFPKCVVVVCLFVSLFCIFYIYDESLLTTSQPTARKRTKGKKEKEHFIFFFFN